MDAIRTIVIATGNAGKARELAELFGTLGVVLQTLAEFTGLTEVAETGSTFAENARLKAVGYAEQTGSYCLADDSGLEVTALGGRPGVLSARYGGEDINYAGRMRLLLGEVAATGDHDRSARFVCSMALARPDGSILATTDGVCEGTLAEAPAGTGGFGYDPIFIPDGFARTFAELPPEAKSRLSHRGIAAAGMLRFLQDDNASLT